MFLLLPYILMSKKTQGRDDPVHFNSKNDNITLTDTSLLCVTCCVRCVFPHRFIKYDSVRLTLTLPLFHRGKRAQRYQALCPRSRSQKARAESDPVCVTPGPPTDTCQCPWAFQRAFWTTSIRDPGGASLKCRLHSALSTESEAPEGD